MSFFQKVVLTESKNYSQLDQNNEYEDVPKTESQDLAFVYDDADCFAAEIAELYSYTEEPEFHENRQFFELDFRKFSSSDIDWFTVSQSIRERYMYHLLDQLDTVDKVVRSQAFRSLLYLLQGTFGECLSATEILSEQLKLQTLWARRNVFLALKCGAYASVLQVLLLEIKYNSWGSTGNRRTNNATSASAAGNATTAGGANAGVGNRKSSHHHPPLIATCLVDSRELRSILAVLYTLVETVRSYHVLPVSEKARMFSETDTEAERDEMHANEDLARTFFQELDEPIGPAQDNVTLTTILFSMVHRFCLGHNPNFPVKKILLLLWKVLLVTLGGVTNLIDKKNRVRAAFGLPPITEPETHVVVRERMRASSPPPMAADLIEGVGGRGSPPRTNAGLSQAGRAGRQGGKGPKRGSLAGGKHRPLESHEDTAKNTLMLFGAMFMNDAASASSTEGAATNPAERGSADSGDRGSADGKHKSGVLSGGKESGLDDQDTDEGDEDDDDSLSTASDVTVIEAEDVDTTIDSQKDREEDDGHPVLVDEVEELEVEQQQKHSPVSDGSGAAPNATSPIQAEAANISAGGVGPMGIGTPRPGSPVNLCDENNSSGETGEKMPLSTPLPGAVPFKVLHPPPNDMSEGGSLSSSQEHHHRGSLSGFSDQDWLMKSGILEDRMSGLPWRPKVHQRDLELYVQHVRSKFIGLQAPGDTMSLFGLPRPIHEAIGVLRDHLYISLGEAQIKREQELIDYPFSKGRENVPDTAAERLYRSLLPNLNGYLIALLKILLAAAPTSRTKTESINILAEIVPEEMPTNITQSLKLSVDVNRHKEVIAKCISAILLLLMKHWKLNHIYQFEYLAQNLVLINCVPLLLKFINQNVLQYAQAKNTLSPLDFPNCVLRKPMTLEENKDNDDPTFCCWRNMFTCVNFLRILNKIIKWKNGRIVMLVVFKSAPILKRVLKVRHALLQLYTLKLLKLQTRYFGRQWRKTNMGTVSAIYQKVRHGLTDDWAFGNEVDTGSHDFHGEELALKQSIDRFNCRRYLQPQSTGSHLPLASAVTSTQSAGGGMSSANTMHLKQAGTGSVDNCLTSLLNTPMELTDHFKRNYVQWLEDEVFAQPIDWDQVLAPRIL